MFELDSMIFSGCFQAYYKLSWNVELLGHFFKGKICQVYNINNLLKELWVNNC